MANETPETLAEMDLLDEDVLKCLGTELVDREEFEENLVSRIQEHLDSQQNELEGVQEELQPQEGVVQEVFGVSMNERDDSQLETLGDSESTLGTGFVTPSKDVQMLSGSSILRQALERAAASSKKIKASSSAASTSKQCANKLTIMAPEAEETEQERLIRCGESTPFGSSVEKPTKKKDSFLDFNKYLQDQKALQNLKGKKERKEEIPRGHRSKTHKKSKNPIDMNVLFPKKRKRKEALGTNESEDPGDLRKRVGKSVAEKSSFYLNYDEDSDYVPSEDSNDSAAEVGNSKGKSNNLRQGGKSAKKSLKDKSSDEESDDYESDYDKPTKRLKRESDDGDLKYYQNRVQQWKENETRFTGEYQTFEGGFKLPMHLWESLYTYQKVGVKWLWELHQQRCGGILGDEMGLGKTIQVINFLTALSCSNLVFRFSEYRGLGPVLLVTPATVMHQWVKELHIWWPPFRVAILHESGSYSGTKSSLVKSIQDGTGILITSYSGLVNNQNEILKYPWHYCILDEGHKIRNPDAQITIVVKQVRTPHRIILSGSPLQNHLKELWSLFDFVYPGKLGTLPTFMEQFAVPITQGGYSNATQVQVAIAYKCAKALRDMINPYLLRRMKSDVKNHLNLPEKNEQVLFCKMTEDQKTLYKSYIDSKEIDSIIHGKYNLFVGLINLRKICNHPHLFDGGPKIIKENPRFQKQLPIVKAGIVRSSSDFTSPSNNVEVDDEESDIEIDKAEESFGDWKKSGKMVVVETLLKLWHKQGHKVLLFTQSRQMLCILEKFVRQCKFNYLRMDGATSIGSRQPLIQKFNEDNEIFIFLLTTRVGGLGVNLTAANRVLLYDPDWNPSTDLQARERAWRIGQLRQVTIYRLILSGTIEEKMYHRQIFKQFLTNRVLKDPKQKRFFKSNDLLELFTFNEGTKGGTESEAIFAGTGSKIKVKKSRRRRPKESSSGKFKGVPNLVKQRNLKEKEEEELDNEKAEKSAQQDEYVLSKLFSKSGVHAALRHDKIVDTDEADYMLVEKEAEVVAKKAISVLKRDRELCWDATSGQANWTGSQGVVREEPAKPKLRFGKKKATFNKSSTSAVATATSSAASKDTTEEDNSKYFSGPSMKDDNKAEGIMSSEQLLGIIKARRSLMPGESNESTDTIDIKTEQLELLRDIREFIAFQAMVDGQATTEELVARFKERLPGEQTPLFKQMLGQLCTFRRVDGRGIWRLKPEFR